MDVKKFISKWLDSDIKNKIGTGLWAAAGICVLILGIKWLVAAGDLADELGASYFGVFLSMFLIFAFYIAIAIGILGSISICTAVVKTWGIMTIIYDIVFLIEIVIANVVMDKIAGINLFDLLDSAFEAVGIGSTIVLIILTQIFTIASIFLLNVTDAPKSRLAALIFCILTGTVGGHLFYVGRNKGGIVRAILSITFIAAFVSWILTIVDLVLIAIGKFKDSDGNVVTEWISGSNPVPAN